MPSGHLQAISKRHTFTSEATAVITIAAVFPLYNFPLAGTFPLVARTDCRNQMAYGLVYLVPVVLQTETQFCPPVGISLLDLQQVSSSPCSCSLEGEVSALRTFLIQIMVFEAKNDVLATGQAWSESECG